MTDRITKKRTRYSHLGADDDVARQRAQREVRQENLRLWAYSKTTEWTQSTVAAYVVERESERPSPVETARIIQSVDDGVLHRDLSLGHGLSGQWLSEETALADIPKPQRRLLKRHLAQLVVIDHLNEDLFWPESPLGIDEVPDWVADCVDVDPVEVKVDQYRRFGNIKEYHLASDVRSQVRREQRSDG